MPQAGVGVSYHPDEAFAIVPAWLLASDVSDRGLRLYALLSALRDYGTDMTTVGRKFLAAKMRCSVDSLDRAKAELERVGAITVSRRRLEDGTNEKNVYTIHRVGSRGGAARGTGAAQYEKTSFREEQDLQLRNGTIAREASEQLDLAGGSAALAPDEDAPLGTVDGQKVTRVELETAQAVLAAFNAEFGTRFSGRGFLRGVVMRLREHPSMTLDEHAELIAKAARNPWWKDSPTPAVVYGNDQVFESMLNAKDRAADRPDFSEYTKA